MRAHSRLHRDRPLGATECGQPPSRNELGRSSDPDRTRHSGTRKPREPPLGNEGLDEMVEGGPGPDSSRRHPRSRCAANQGSALPAVGPRFHAVGRHLPAVASARHFGDRHEHLGRGAPYSRCSSCHCSCCTRLPPAPPRSGRSAGARRGTPDGKTCLVGRTVRGACRAVCQLLDTASGEARRPPVLPAQSVAGAACVVPARPRASRHSDSGGAARFRLGVSLA